MAPAVLLALLISALPHASSHLVSPKFPGYGFSWYDPNCGFSCYNAVSTASLVCPSMDSSDQHMHMSMSGAATPACQAQSIPFLTTVAYCMSTKCVEANTPVWKREEYWSTKMLSDGTVQPKWTYSESVASLTGQAPTMVFNSSSKEMMNMTMLISAADYAKQFNFNKNFDYLEMLQPRYSFVLLALGFGIPILCTLLVKLPYMTRLIDRLKPFAIYPSTIGSYQVRPLPWLLGNAPTLGQAAYIALFAGLNLILCAVNYHSSQPHPWGYDRRVEILSYIGYRTGHIGYALLPLVVLFSSRNNFLLWITNWSYGTYLLLHRWVARIFALQAIIHSITLLLTYKGAGTYPTESAKPYWLWGIVATVLTCAMLILSALYFRRVAYEIFLILHIVLAVFVLVGCWYHVVLMWGYNFYDNWLYAAIAVWFFDRAVRVLRVLKNGMRYATVTDVGDHYVRVDIPHVRWPNAPGYTGFVGFPSLHPFRPWENHPFSINATATFHSYRQKPRSEISSSNGGAGLLTDDKVAPEPSVQRVSSSSPQSTAGVTFIIKKRTGLTSYLRSHSKLLTILDGPYPHNTSTAVLQADRLFLIGGGIGITGLLSWIHHHPNVKLAWSVQSHAEALVREVSPALESIAEKDVRIGERFDVRTLIQKEADEGWKRIGIVVCGPPKMCDEVRQVVAALGRARASTGVVFELHVDAFSW